MITDVRSWIVECDGCRKRMLDPSNDSEAHFATRDDAVSAVHAGLEWLIPTGISASDGDIVAYCSPECGTTDAPAVMVDGFVFVRGTYAGDVKFQPARSDLSPLTWSELNEYAAMLGKPIIKLRPAPLTDDEVRRHYDDGFEYGKRERENLRDQLAQAAVDMGRMTELCKARSKTLDLIGEELDKAGINYPHGAKGVNDLAAMYRGAVDDLEKINTTLIDAGINASRDEGVADLAVLASNRARELNAAEAKIAELTAEAARNAPILDAARAWVKVVDNASNPIRTWGDTHDHALVEAVHTNDPGNPPTARAVLEDAIQGWKNDLANQPFPEYVIIDGPHQGHTGHHMIGHVSAAPDMVLLPQTQGVLKLGETRSTMYVMCRERDGKPALTEDGKLQYMIDPDARIASDTSAGGEPR